jgi:Heavy metal associated domain 2
MTNNSDFEKAAVCAANVVSGSASLPPRDIEIVHQLPGRLRIRAAWLKGDAGAGEEVKYRLAQIAGVKAVRANASTGSLLVEYDAAAVSPGKIINAFRKTGCNPPPAKAPERTPGWVDELANSVGQWLVQVAAERIALTIIGALV